MCYRNGKIYGCGCKRKVQPSDNIRHHPKVNPAVCTKKELRLVQVRQDCPRCRGFEDLEPDTNENDGVIWLRSPKVHTKYRLELPGNRTPVIPAPPAQGLFKRLFSKARASPGAASRTVSNAGTRPATPVQALRADGHQRDHGLIAFAIPRGKSGLRKRQDDDLQEDREPVTNILQWRDPDAKERHMPPPLAQLEPDRDHLARLNLNALNNNAREQQAEVEELERVEEEEEEEQASEHDQEAEADHHTHVARYNNARSHAIRRSDARSHATRISNVRSQLTRGSDGNSIISGIGTEMLIGAPDYVPRRRR
jgi:hypothetical protein